MTELTPQARELLGALDKKHLENIKAIQRVRELHKQVYEFCSECSKWHEFGSVEYPCDTIKALDGEQ